MKRKSEFVTNVTLSPVLVKKIYVNVLVTILASIALEDELEAIASSAAFDTNLR
jgi:hypothetical protein